MSQRSHEHVRQELYNTMVENRPDILMNYRELRDKEFNGGITESERRLMYGFREMLRLTGGDPEECPMAPITGAVEQQ